jgi:hypothetical protein
MAMGKETENIGVIVVDVQGDFTKFKNGYLAVEGTDEAFVKSVEENTKKLKTAQSMPPRTGIPRIMPLSLPTIKGKRPLMSLSFTERIRSSGPLTAFRKLLEQRSCWITNYSKPW